MTADHDRVLLDLEDGPLILTILSASSARIPGSAAREAAWPIWRLADGNGRPHLLERQGYGYILHCERSRHLEGIAFDGRPLTLDSMGAISEAMSAGLPPIVLHETGEFRCMAAHRLVIGDDGERYRFTFASGSHILIIEVFRDRPWTFSVSIGEVVPEIASSWKEGASPPRPQFSWTRKRKS